MSITISLPSNPLGSVSSNANFTAFDDFAGFSEGEPDMSLVDLVDDVTKEEFIDSFMDTPGAFVYELDFFADTQKANALSVIGLDVAFYTSNPDVRRNPDSDRLETQGLLDGVTTDSSTRGQRARAERAEQAEWIANMPDPAFAVRIDLGIELSSQSFLWDSKTSPPAPGMHQVLLAGRAPPPGMHRVLLADRPTVEGPLRAGVITATVSEEVAESTNYNGNFTALAERSIENSRSPFDLLAQADPMLPSLGAKVGMDSTEPSASPFLEEARLIGLDNIWLRRSLVKTRLGLERQAYDYSKDAVQLSNAAAGNANVSSLGSTVLGYVATLRSFKKRIRRRIELDKELLGNQKNIYVKLTPVLRGSKSLPLEEAPLGFPKFFAVGHRDKVAEILEPQIAPEITVLKSSRGSVALKVKQLDPCGRLLKVTRTVYRPRMIPRESAPIEVETVSTRNGNTVVVLDDTTVENVFPNRVTYTAITIGASTELGPATSVIVRGLNPAYASPDSALNSVSIIAKNEPERVKIEARNVPANTLTFRLLREDLGLGGDLSDRVTVIPAVNGKKENSPGGAEMTFEDFNTSPGRKYRYFGAIRQDIGSELLCADDELLIRIVPTKPLPVEVAMLAGLGGHGNKGWSAQIAFQVTPKNDDMNFLLKMLKETGVSEVFINEIERQKSVFADLVVFVLERVDRVSGQRVSFGIQTLGFSDSPISTAMKGIPPLSSGRRYTYFARVCMRPPEALLQDVFASFSSRQRPGIKDKKALTQKFMSVYSSLYGDSPGGAIPSTSEMIQGVPVGDNLKAGDTGIVLEADIVTPERKPKPTELVAYRYRAGAMSPRVRLLWSSTEGNVKLIRQSLVVASLNGRSWLVGTTTVDGDTNSFRFTDRRACSHPGRISYAVMFVYNDWTVSVASNLAFVENRSYTPNGLMEGGVYEGVS